MTQPAPSSLPATVAELLAALPPDATPSDRRAALEQYARALRLPTFTSWEEWTADAEPLTAEDQVELERFRQSIRSTKAADRARDHEREP